MNPPSALDPPMWFGVDPLPGTYGVGDFVGHYEGDHQLVLAGRDARLIQKRCLSVQHQPPVLHRPAAKVRHRHVILNRKINFG